MFTKLFVGFILCLLASFIGNFRALACSCARTSFVAPTEVSNDVPANTRIWFYSYGPATVRLEDNSGKEIPGESHVLSGLLSMMVFTPSSLLGVGQTYHAFLISENGFTNEIEETKFTVTQEADTTAPEMIEATLLRTVVSGAGPVPLSSCGALAYGVFGISTHFLAVARVSPYPEEEILNPVFPFAEGISGFAAAGEKEMVIGESSCFNSWPQAAAGASGDVEFGAFDLAGNFSGWSESIRLELPRAVQGDDLVVTRSEVPLFGCQRSSAIESQSSAAGFGEMFSLVLLFFLFGIVSQRNRR